jgi:hypothetical protein
MLSVQNEAFLAWVCVLARQKSLPPNRTPVHNGELFFITLLQAVAGSTGTEFFSCFVIKRDAAARWKSDFNYVVATLKKMIALASVGREHSGPGTSLQTEMTVEAVRHTVSAKVVPLPFFNPPKKPPRPSLSYKRARVVSVFPFYLARRKIV